MPVVIYQKFAPCSLAVSICRSQPYPSEDDECSVDFIFTEVSSTFVLVLFFCIIQTMDSRLRFSTKRTMEVFCMF